MDVLPPPLVDLILQELEAQGGMKSVAKLRLVSKSCRDAVASYTGSPARQFWAQELPKICQILPGMRGLKAVEIDAAFDISPLSACCQLTQLVLRGHLEQDNSPHHKVPFITPKVDVSLLGPSLKSLTVKGVLTKRASHSAIQCTGLTELIYHFNRDIAELWELLDHLLKLKVRIF